MDRKRFLERKRNLSDHLPHKAECKKCRIFLKYRRVFGFPENYCEYLHICNEVHFGKVDEGLNGSENKYIQ
jgi:hypothetical protein